MSVQNIHAGHRGRMREKFITYGKEVFHSHELLEMLLYSVIPLRDTNETAQLLLKRFSSLDGIFWQTKELLMNVGGVGERASELLLSVGKIGLDEVFGGSKSRELSYSDMGEYFTAFFGGMTEPAVAVMLLNSRLEFIACEKIYSSDYGSAAVKAESFMDAALKNRASVAVIAHNHPFGTAYPTPQDIETNKAVEAALKSAGITLYEHFTVSGNSYLGFMKHMQNGSAQALHSEYAEPSLYGDNDIRLLAEILSYVSKSPVADAEKILSKFASLAGLAAADVYMISDALSGDMQTSVYIKLIFSVVSRRFCDKFRFKTKHGEEEISDYFKALMLDISDETVYMLSFSQDGKAIAADLVGKGALNSLGIMPRKIIEILKRRGAASAVIAHNHPDGRAIPSLDDTVGTGRLCEILSSAGLCLENHYIIAGGEHCAVPFER